MELFSTLLHTLVAVGTALSVFVGNIVDTYTPSETVVSIAPEARPDFPALPKLYVPADAPQAPKTSGASQTSGQGAAKPAASGSAGASSTSASSAAVTAPAVSSDTLNAQARAALVNILCLTKTGVHPISGSGVFIDSRGIVLTNAHVGQMFLLKDYPSHGNVDCTLRTGNPAADAYRAELLYLPPAWIKAHAAQITQAEARGTGEDDYAFLLVTETTSSKNSLPTSFPALPMTTDEPKVGQDMFLAAYPAGFLDGNSIRKSLYASSAYAAVKELFTFPTKGKTVDLVSIGGTVVSQGGSSGGAALRAQDGRLQGIIATATTEESTAGRDLRAITLAHINRSLAKYDMGGLKELLLADVHDEAEEFGDSVAPSERAALVQVLNKQ
jgi:hypothetical protein